MLEKTENKPAKGNPPGGNGIVLKILRCGVFAVPDCLPRREKNSYL
jgi:hypothetical protein